VKVGSIDLAQPASLDRWYFGFALICRRLSRKEAEMQGGIFLARVSFRRLLPKGPAARIRIQVSLKELKR
jgi:hypothetical protein